MTFKKHVLQPLFLVAAFFAVAQLGSAVNAMAVYNYASTDLFVSFDCGFLCRNDWLLLAGNFTSRPNESGTLTTSNNSAGSTRCSVQVDQHGWVVLTQGGGTVAVNSYHQDGSPDDSCSFTSRTS